MSSRKAATAKTAAVRRSAAAPAAAKPAAALKPAAAVEPVAVKPLAATKPAIKPVPTAKVASASSAEATRLATEIERAIVAGELDVLSPKAVQTLMAAMCRLYGMQIEAGQNFLPLEGRNSVSPTEIMTITSSLLKAANLAVFELGMWQSWTGR